MTIYTPVYRVKIGTTNVTTATLSGLTITSGRQDIYSQANAGYCNLTLIETLEAAIPYQVNDAVTIEVKDSTATFVPIFGGFLTDISVIVQNSGSTATSQRIQIVAVGALARLSRSVYTGNISADEDGDQIEEILSTVLFDQWNEVPAAEDWLSYDATTQWQDAENSGYGEVDTPGNYNLATQTGLNATVYSIVSGLATSGLGYIFEDSEGRIGYADSTHRTVYLSTNGYVDLDGNHATGPGLRIVKRAGDVRNAITVTYGSTSSNSVSDEDADSISDYGRLENIVTTTLLNSADATSQAAFYLTLRAEPQYQMNSITYELGNPEIDDADRDSLLEVFMGMPVNIVNLPSNMVNGEFQGFVEGWTWTANMNQISLTMTVSPVAFSLQAFAWDDVPAVEYWASINPALDWLNATIVA